MQNIVGLVCPQIFYSLTVGRFYKPKSQSKPNNNKKDSIATRHAPDLWNWVTSTILMKKDTELPRETGLGQGIRKVTRAPAELGSEEVLLPTQPERLRMCRRGTMEG